MHYWRAKMTDFHNAAENAVGTDANEINLCVKHCNVISGGDAAMKNQERQQRLHTLSCAAHSTTLLNNQHFITLLIYAKIFTVCITMLNCCQHS